MEQTPDFFKTAKEGWTDGIIVQNRELFIYYAVRMLYDYQPQRPEDGRSRRCSGGVPIPPILDTGVLVVTKDNVDKVLAAMERQVGAAPILLGEPGMPSRLHARIPQSSVRAMAAASDDAASAFSASRPTRS